MRSRSYLTILSRFQSSVTPTPKNFIARPRVRTDPFPSHCALFLWPAVATPKTTLPEPSHGASRSTFFSVRASTPSLTAIPTRTFGSSRSTTLPHNSGSVSCSQPATCLLQQTSLMSQSTSNDSLFPSSLTRPASIHSTPLFSRGWASYPTSHWRPSASPLISSLHSLTALEWSLTTASLAPHSRSSRSSPTTLSPHASNSPVNPSNSFSPQRRSP